MSLSTKLSPRVSVVCVLLLAGTALPACSDPTVPEVPDTGQRPDGAVDSGAHDSAVDTGPRPDTGPMPDTGPITPDTGTDADVDGGGTIIDDAGTDAAVAATCGNGTLDTGETCDTAITTGAGACPTSCDDAVVCTTDAMTGSACTAACTHTPLTASGTTVDMCCPTGATHTTDTDCPASCGNGMVDSGETCDTGIASGTGSCPTMATCNDAMACTTDALVSGATCNAMCTHTAITAPSGTTVDMCCPTGANHNTDTDCTPVCGNTVVEGPGETCEPPSTATCDAACHAIAGCGDGVLQTGEDCDDSNRRNLDGCDSACHYEAFARLTDLQISRAMAPAMCAHTRNQLGAHALSMTAVDGLGMIQGLNDTLHTDVSSGSLNVILQALGLVDLNGVNNPTFNLGVMNGVPDPAAGTWPTAGNPIDWRFFIDHNTVNTMGLPTTTLPGSIVSRALTSGPATVTIPLALSGSVANLTLFNTHAIGAVQMPTAHPTYPASLRAGLTSFNTINGNGAGQGLCGDISVGSLAAIPIPELLTPTGDAPCTQNYTYCGMGMPVGPTCNSLLDALVGGCNYILTIISPTQPDVNATGGTTGIVNLTVSATGRHVTNVAANANEAYSAFFTFTANRAHASGEVCTAASQCQAGQTMCSPLTMGTPMICH